MTDRYDEVPYLGHAYQPSHVENIARIAALFQIDFPPIESCRVLELGCGDGTNIANMAYQLPDATFVGIDNSSVQIDRGKRMARFVGLSNIRLVNMDIDEVDESLGLFDYIICHGVFSWVSDRTRQNILRLIERSLQPKGIAFISYNALPGWRLHGILRDMMLFHSQKMDTPKDQLEQAKAMVKFVGEHVLQPQSAYGQFINSTIDELFKMDDEYIYHEYLEDNNKAFYFQEFIRLIQPHGLQYLGDSEFSGMNANNLKSSSKEVLDSISSNIYDLEQYMDFLRCRKFRSNLVVHSHGDIPREVSLTPFLGFHYSFHPDSSQAIEEMPNPEKVDEFMNKISFGDGTSAASDSIFRAVLGLLSERWPGRMHFDEITTGVEERLAIRIGAEDKVKMCSLFLSLFLKSMIDIHLFSPRIFNGISEHPEVNPISRFLASHQRMICSQSHNSLFLPNDATRLVLQRMDGRTSVGELLSILESEKSTIDEEGWDKPGFCKGKLDKLLGDLLINGALIS